MQSKIRSIVESKLFEYAIIAVILASAVLIGLETSPEIVGAYSHLIDLGNQVILGVFILEAFLKMTAVAPRLQDYFKSGWNIFDFSIIVLALMPGTGEFAMVARMARLLRVVRLISVIPELRLIVETLMRSIPSMGNIMLLMGVIFYIFAVAGQQMFHEHDPVHWGNLGISLLTLFRIVTLEDWTDVMYVAMELNPLNWIYFVAFVIMGTFVIVNLFIAVVLNNLDEAKQARLKELRDPPTADHLMDELVKTQQTLEDLRNRLADYEGMRRDSQTGSVRS